MCNENVVSLIIQGLVAIGTVGAVVVVLFKEWLGRPKLVLEIPNNSIVLGHSDNNNQTIFFHLKVRNERPYFPVKNCRILLTAIQIDKEENEELVFPLSFLWTPVEDKKDVANFSKEKILGFGFLSKNDFRLYLSHNHENKGQVENNNKVCYSLQITADNYTKGNEHIIAIKWDGKFEYDKNKIKNHLKVEKIE